MTLKELSKIDFKIWTGDGYKDFGKKELNEMILSRLFKNKAFCWRGSKNQKIEFDFRYLCSRRSMITRGKTKSHYDDLKLTKVSIDDILNYDDGGL